MSTTTVVRVGKGYQSGNAVRRSIKLYGPQQQQPSEYLENPFAPTIVTSSGGITNAQTNSQRRRSFFGTLRGREQAERANDNFADNYAPAGELRRSGSEAVLNRAHAEGAKSKGGIQRNDTLTLRVKRAFMRVVSSPVTARAVVTTAA